MATFPVQHIIVAQRTMEVLELSGHHLRRV